MTEKGESMATVAQIKRMSEETDKALTDLQDNHPKTFDIIYDYILDLKRQVTILSEQADRQKQRVARALSLIEAEAKRQGDDTDLLFAVGVVTGVFHD